jgi:hypothetical protein
MKLRHFVIASSALRQKLKSLSAMAMNTTSSLRRERNTMGISTQFSVEFCAGVVAATS